MFRDLNQKHLKPLSKYASGVFSGHVAHTSTHHSIEPPNNFKTETHCCQTTTASSKKPTCPEPLCSPDVGLFVERSSQRKDPVACEGRRLVGSLTSNVAFFHCSKCETQSVAPLFDLEVDDILNLSPCGISFQRVPGIANEDKLHMSSSCLTQRKYWHRYAGPLDDRSLCFHAISLDRDQGCSPYHAEDQTKPRNVSELANQQPPQASCICCDGDQQCLSDSLQIKEPESKQHSSVLDSKVMSAELSSKPERSPRRGHDDNLWGVGLPMSSGDAVESPLQVKVGEPLLCFLDLTQNSCFYIFQTRQVRSVVTKKVNSCHPRSSQVANLTTRGSQPPM